MTICNHERWLYVLPSLGIGDRYFYVDDKNFLCADCGQWIRFGNIDVEKIVNIKHFSKKECPHDITYYTFNINYYTSQRTTLCLRCGHEWIKTPLVYFNVAASTNWKEEQDEKRREEALERFKNGEIL